MHVPFNRPFIVGQELYFIARAVIEGHLSGDGPYTKRCHAWLESQYRGSAAMLTHSCTAALEMAAILCNIGPGDEVIMPSYSFVSTANAFVLRGGTPVFVDIRSDTLNMDERLVDDAVTPKTRAIVPVHYGGFPCAMGTLMDIARRHGLFVVEDAAQALLSYDGDRPLGGIGHLGCLSFHETKNVISGEGGALIVNDPTLAERAEVIREKGTNRAKFFRGEVDKYTWVDIGSSYLPSEVIGAFLFAQLEHAETIVAKRKSIWRQYAAGLRPLQDEGYVTLPQGGDPAAVANGHMFYLLLDDLETRTAMIEHLRSLDIHAVFHYVPLHSSPAGREFGRVGSRMTVTDEIADRLLRLPLYYEMQAGDVDRVVEGVETFFRSATKGMGSRRVDDSAY